MSQSDIFLKKMHYHVNILPSKMILKNFFFLFIFDPKHVLVVAFQIKVNSRLQYLELLSLIHWLLSKLPYNLKKLA